MKKNYYAPEVEIIFAEIDIFTYSEDEEWEGPMIEAADPNGNNNA